MIRRVREDEDLTARRSRQLPKAVKDMYGCNRYVLSRRATPGIFLVSLQAFTALRRPVVASRGSCSKKRTRLRAPSKNGFLLLWNLFCTTHMHQHDKAVN